MLHQLTGLSVAKSPWQTKLTTAVDCETAPFSTGTPGQNTSHQCGAPCMATLVMIVFPLSSPMMLKNETPTS
jgi:hypothetical protein